MNIITFSTKEEIGQKVAEMVAETIASKAHPVLGLATGSSPLPVYAALVKMVAAKRLSFKKVTTFNLDEYIACPLPDQTYRAFMDQNLFSLVDIKKENTHFPDYRNPEQYDQDILKADGVDLQLLGIGRDGHIGFNEPGTPFGSRTHIEKLDPSTISANARFFGGDENLVPKEAVTMGLGTIMQARHIVLVADDPSKKEAVTRLLKGEVSTSCPASVLLCHSNVDIVVTKDVLE